MSEKCDKYESLFVFESEEKLAEHLRKCEECRNLHEKMNKTASVIKEVSFHYKNYGKPNRKSHLVKTAAGLVIIVLVCLMINQTVLNNNINGYNISYNTTNNATRESDSVIDEMGLPTDDYGLLMVY